MSKTVERDPYAIAVERRRGHTSPARSEVTASGDGAPLAVNLVAAHDLLHAAVGALVVILCLALGPGRLFGASVAQVALTATSAAYLLARTAAGLHEGRAHARWTHLGLAAVGVAVACLLARRSPLYLGDAALWAGSAALLLLPSSRRFFDRT